MSDSTLEKILDYLLVPFALIAGIVYGIFILVRAGYRKVDEWVEEKGWKIRGQ